MNIYLLVFLLISWPIASRNIGITYRPWSGRLGDNIFYVSKCLMLSDKYNIDFYYQPFDLSDKFTLHTNSTHLTPTLKKTFKREFVLRHEFHLEDLLKKPEVDDMLFIVNFYTKTYDHFTEYCLRNKKFEQHLKTLWMPCHDQEIFEYQLPHDMITVAVHVRKGSFIDGPLASKSDDPDNPLRETKKLSHGGYISDKKFPEKFPPDKYYLDALEKLSHTLNNRPLYVYIFTDYAEPQKIVDYYKKRLNLPNLVWAQCDNQSNYKDSIIRDLWLMSQCDCLIRPDSFFSRSAELIGNYKIVLYPLGHMWKNNMLIITKIGMTKYGKI